MMLKAKQNIEQCLLRVFLAIVLAGFLPTASAQAFSEPDRGPVTPPPLLSLPIKCDPGKTCFIQNYVDMDPGPEVSDYSCGAAGFNGHKGVDIRVISRAEMARGVEVLAAAPGRVIRARDGMADIVLRSQADRKKLKGKDCGNGVLIAHAGGLSTQYCHMLLGSLKVKPGQMVSRGQALGQIGLSGNTAFPHVHLTTRVKGKIVSPFSGQPQGQGCKSSENKPLWTKDVLAAFPYRTGEIIKTGFAPGGVNLNELRAGKIPTPPRSKDAPAMVFYAWAINLLQGDIFKLIINGPQGEVISHPAKPLNRRKAVYFQFAGKKRPKGGWPRGEYTGVIEIIRNGKVVIESASKLEIK